MRFHGKNKIVIIVRKFIDGDPMQDKLRLKVSKKKKLNRFKRAQLVVEKKVFGLTITRAEYNVDVVV